MTSKRLDEYLRGLNLEQRDAVTTHKDQCCIIAGPGTGKTSVITGRITYLIERMGVAPEKIMALTFSVKAAEEMRDRANKMCPEAKSCRICTFHSACHKILGQAYSLVTTAEQTRIMGKAKENYEFEEGLKDRDILGLISNCKNNGDLDFQGIKRTDMRKVAHLYQRNLRESDLIDFDDLLLETKLLFERDANKRKQISSSIEYLLVDEFQDTNLVQYDIAKHLASVHQRIFVVGDPDQNIFMWRAASSRNITMFKSDYPKSLVVNLVQNYRSHEVILNTAMCLMETDGQQRNLQSNATSHGHVIVKETVDDSAQVRFIRSEIARLVQQTGVRYSDIAVLFRCKYHSNALESELREFGIPFQRKVSQTETTETRDVKFMSTHLKLLEDASNSKLFFEALYLSKIDICSEALKEIGSSHMKNKCSIFATIRDYIAMNDTYVCAEEKDSLEKYCSMMESLIQMKKLDKNPVTVLKSLISESHFLDSATGEEIERYYNLIRHLSSENITSIKDIINQMAHFVSDSSSQEDCKVTFSTLHSSKGLEWPIVFIFNLVEGQIPYERNENREEERRLLYVGITRAKQTLYLLCSKAQQIDKESVRLHDQSPFLTQIRRRGKEWIQWEGIDQNMSRQFLSECLRDHEVIRMIKKQKKIDEQVDEQVQENERDVFQYNSQDSYGSLYLPASQCSQDSHVESEELSRASYNNIPLVKSSFKPPRVLSNAQNVDKTSNKRTGSNAKLYLRISKRAKE